MLEQTSASSAQRQDLRARFAAYEREHPGAFARDAAKALGVGEAQIIASRCGASAVRLSTRFRELVEAMPALGPVKTMARNEAVVLEKWGVYERVEIEGTMGQVVGEDIDLRLFLRNWHVAFAVEEQTARGPRRSVQIFDGHGTSIHKVYFEGEHDEARYARLVAEHAAKDQSPEEPIEPLPQAPPARPDTEVDVAAFQRAWDQMQDPHEFFHLMRRFGLTRPQALRLAGEARARRVANTSLQGALERAALRELPIMIFVGNRGIIQIHTGPIRHVEIMSGWLNVLDPRFNLHVREEEIASCWVVEKPTKDGIVTSFEAFDAAGENVLLLFGKRKPGTPEDPRWRALLEDATTQAAP